MYDLYRVVCWENNNQIFADIFLAGESRPENSLTHDTIFMMRKKITPQAKLVETGIILTDLGNSNISLRYEKVYNKRLKMHQDNIRKKTDKIIVNTFQNMQERKKVRTFDISLVSMNVLFDIHHNPKDEIYSARQYKLIQEEQRINKLQRLKRIKLKYYANTSYADKPHLILALKQAMYRGG